MLCRYHDGVYALGNASVTVLYGHLALGVGTQIGHNLSLLSNLGQCTHDEVRQVERHGHQALRLVGGIAEHHTLVAGSLVFVVLAVHTTVDVLALLMDGCQYAA